MVARATVKDGSLAVSIVLALSTFDPTPDNYGKRLFLHYSDLNDPESMMRLLERIQPE